ncbi:Rv2231c family pyridoxal phosphate-dependent protein CobC [Kribbella deserti]|uniref:Aminotransferase n=1 Tax=Kribbella deserti TaxID=1926257 RepID=A0ABV6QUB9_9ACTN
MTDFDLDHHGDVEVGEGLVDLAVNVRTDTPPQWLLDEIATSLTDLAAYPRQDAAMAAVAVRHGISPDRLLLTAGAAEAFVLIARAFKPQRAVVVHPQFTEPEAALRAAGHSVDRVILRPEDGFRLDPAAVPEDADLVVIGNPTNPTSVLHPAEDLRALARPGRVLVVDEAFMDAVPGEPESVLGAESPGLLVIRSLTKTWGLAGLRVGYLVAEPGLVARLAAVQPHWPVSTPALAAAIACSNNRAITTAVAAAQELDRQRAHLVAGLAEVDAVKTYGVARGPFLLLRLDGAAVVRTALRERGFAVRRGDTFPGLGPDWLRIAVRPEATADLFVKTLREVLG